LQTGETITGSRDCFERSLAAALTLAGFDNSLLESIEALPLEDASLTSFGFTGVAEVTRTAF
jgi:hypothetical protein